MAVKGRMPICSSTCLRIQCFVIGYMSLVACVLNIMFHILIVAILTRGFQCQPNGYSFKVLEMPWLEPFLALLNLGTHGFYPYPTHLNIYDNQIDRMKFPKEPSCFRGMIHVYLIDVIFLLMNLIWLKFVVAFVDAVHKRDVKPMRMFLHLFIVKLCLQIICFGFKPINMHSFRIEPSWFMVIADICVSTIFLFIINGYVNALKRDKDPGSGDLPPPYIEYLTATKQTQVSVPEKKLEDVIVVNNDNDKKAEIKHEGL